VLLNTANALEFLNRLEEAKHFCEQALGLYEELGSMRGMAIAKTSLGDICVKKNEYEQALQLYCEALAIGEQVSDKRLITEVCLNLGRLYSKKAKDYGDERGYSTLEQGSENVAFKQPKTRA
jgi:tetratricopeptide (TPR) repeat protein